MCLLLLALPLGLPLFVAAFVFAAQYFCQDAMFWLSGLSSGRLSFSFTQPTARNGIVCALSGWFGTTPLALDRPTDSCKEPCEVVGDEGILALLCLQRMLNSAGLCL